MKKKSSETYAEIHTGVSESYVSGNSDQGSTEGFLQYTFYPEHNDYDFKCQADVLTLIAAQVYEFDVSVGKFPPLNLEF